MSNNKFMRFFGFIAMLAFVVTALHNVGLGFQVIPITWEYGGYLAINMLFTLALSGIYFRQVEQAGYLGLVGFILSTLSLFIAIIWTGYASLAFPVLQAQFPDAVRPVLQGPMGIASMINMYLSFLGNLVFFIATLRAKVFPRPATWIILAGLLLSWAMLPYNLAAIIMAFGIAWYGYAMWKEERSSTPLVQAQATT
jgi:hypothetical protein